MAFIGDFHNTCIAKVALFRSLVCTLHLFTLLGHWRIQYDCVAGITRRISTGGQRAVPCTYTPAKNYFVASVLEARKEWQWQILGKFLEIARQSADR
jgi:hypothetical protein